MSLRIYTKTGDKGSTSLIGGTKVSKSHLRIEAYGTVDELNSFIGLLGDHLAAASSSVANVPAASSSAANVPAAPTSSANVPAAPTSSAPPSATATSSSTIPAAPAPSPLLPEAQSLLREIQDRLFTIGSSLACDPEKEPKFAIPDLRESDLTHLERSIDTMDAELPPMKSFILPGGHPAVSTAHVARCVCRRAERCVVRLQEEAPVEPLVLQYLNRLSDYLFELSRFVGHRLAVPEIPWKPRV